MMNRLMKKTMLLGTTAIIMGSAFIPVSVFAEGSTEGETAESAVVKMSFGDGILKAEVPENESWKEVKNENNCVTITDGANMIIFNHYDVLDELPKIASFDQEHEMTYEISFSKSDVSITLVGEIAHTSDYASIKKIIDNIEVDLSKLDPDHIHKKHELNKEVFSVRDVNYTVWVNAADGLCIRDNGSSSANYITTEPYGTALTVTGEVLKNGIDMGWRRVTDGRGITGYCSAQFLSSSEIVVNKVEEKHPEEKKDLSGYPQTAEVFCSGDLRCVYLCDDGNYTDYEGHIYNAVSNFTTFIREDGLTYYDTTAIGLDTSNWYGEEDEEIEKGDLDNVDYSGEMCFDDEEFDAYIPQMVAIYCSGDLRYVYYVGDGIYVDDEGNSYTAVDNYTTFIRDDGTTYYTAEAAGIDPDTWE